MKKIIIVLMLFILIGCSNQIDVEEGKYKVISDKNSVSVITKDSNVLSTTKYIYNNNTLSECIMTSKYESDEVALKSYESINSNEELIKEYKNIELSKNEIIFTLDTSKLGSLVDLSKDDLYSLQYETYKDNISK